MVAKVATKPEFLVAKEKMLVALATISKSFKFSTFLLGIIDYSLTLDYSLNFPYGHLYITGSLFGPRNAKNHTFPTVPL